MNINESLPKKILVFHILFISCCCLISTDTFSQNNYRLIIHSADKDSSLSQSSKLNRIQSLKLQTSFFNRQLCTNYISKLPEILAAKGYPAVSVDSVFYDSTSTHINLYLGEQYKWIEINTDSIDKKLLNETGWNVRLFHNNKMDFSQLQNQQQKILDYYETREYPFATIKLDSIKIKEDKIKAQLKIDKGSLYLIDSIRVYGKVKIKNLFLQRYPGIEKGSLYDKINCKISAKGFWNFPILMRKVSMHYNMQYSLLNTGT